MKLSHAAVPLSVIIGSVSINGAMELVEIPNNKQIPMTKIPNNKPVPMNTKGSLGSLGSKAL